MAEEVKVVNQNQKQQNQQKDFTNKVQKTEIKREVKQESKQEVKQEIKQENKETKQEVKQEKADPKFNGPVNVSVSRNELSVKPFPAFKMDEATVDFDKDNKIVEAKTVEDKVDKTEKFQKVSGTVISVSKHDYIVKTKEGNGVLVIGKHNKKIGDII